MTSRKIVHYKIVNCVKNCQGAKNDKCKCLNKFLEIVYINGLTHIFLFKLFDNDQAPNELNENEMEVKNSVFDNNVHCIYLLQIHIHTNKYILVHKQCLPGVGMWHERIECHQYLFSV